MVPRTRIHTALLAAAVVATACIGALNGAMTASGAVAGDGSSGSTTLTAHAPILIDSDAAFCTTGSGVVNCDTADGSAEKPFEITGWKINASDDPETPAITISGTTKHVIVHNNSLTTPTGVSARTLVLKDAANVRVHDNTIASAHSNAVDASGLSNARFVSNTFNATAPGGTHALVRIVNSPGTLVEKNAFTTAEDAMDGAASFIDLATSNASILRGNAHGPGDLTAIVLSDATGVEVDGDTFQTVYAGVNATRADNLTVTQVAMDEVRNGINLQTSMGVLVLGSDIVDSWPCSPSCETENTGIYGVDSDVTIEDTLIQEFDTSILLLSS